MVDLEGFTPDVTDLPVTIPAEGVAAFDVTFQPTERRRYVAVLEAVVEGQGLEVDISGEGVQNQFSETFDVVEPAEEPIYAHSYDTLYSYDTATGSLSTIGSTGTVLFDIAIDAYGQLWGIDMSGNIYQVDSATGVATSFMPTPAYGNGLAVLQDGSLVVSNDYTLAEMTGLRATPRLWPPAPGAQLGRCGGVGWVSVLDGHRRWGRQPARVRHSDGHIVEPGQHGGLFAVGARGARR